MRHVFIFYTYFLDLNGENFVVGGIETYIRQLSTLIKSRGDIPVIVQYANFNFHKTLDNIDIYGIDVKNIKSNKKKTKEVIKFISKKFDKTKDILIFANDLNCINVFTNRVIAIQHGIGWDGTSQNRLRKAFWYIDIILKSIRAIKIIGRIKNINHVVCVDYNYLNWYRTQVTYNNKFFYVIPNCTYNINTGIIKENDCIKIIFARRFHTYRGTRLFADVTKEILKVHKSINVTFAGEGPDEQYLKEQFRNLNQVNFIKYDSNNSLKIHSEYHIAVVPTLCSEGTSLSLLEAMAAKCAVIASNVGGMTNIILDGFNGLLINPDYHSLYNALNRVITDKELRERLSQNAYNSVSEAFNNELWSYKWNKVFDNLDEV